MTDEQQREIYLLLSIGCDRETACNYVGVPIDQLRRILIRHGPTGVRLRRAEATAEFTHMRNIYQAAKEDKQWRGSVWWLERRAPYRYGSRQPSAVTSAELDAYVERIANAIREEVRNDDERQRLLQCIEELDGVMTYS